MEEVAAGSCLYPWAQRPNLEAWSQGPWGGEPDLQGSEHWLARAGVSEIALEREFDEGGFMSVAKWKHPLLMEQSAPAGVKSMAAEISAP